MKTKNLTKLSDYITVVESISREIETNDQNEFLLFRGQNVNKPLLPKLARELNSFRNVGLPRTLRKYDFYTMEQIMINEFKRRARPFLEREPESVWDWVSIAQHHGMDTRLLDWTDNSLIALYFAVTGSELRMQPTVWILRIKKEEIITPQKNVDLFRLKQTRIFKPSLISKRLIAQSGWFTIHKYLKKTDTFVPLERNGKFRLQLTKVSLGIDKRLEIISDLNACGINASNLFLDLDGLCDYINWRKDSEQFKKIRMPLLKESRSKRKRLSTKRDKVNKN